MSFAALANLAEGLCLNAMLTLQIRKFPHLPCRDININSVHNGMAIYFALDNINIHFTPRSFYAVSTQN
jgi:hypothetical protein